MSDTATNTDLAVSITAGRALLDMAAEAPHHAAKVRFVIEAQGHYRDAMGMLIKDRSSLLGIKVGVQRMRLGKLHIMLTGNPIWPGCDEDPDNVLDEARALGCELEAFFG